MSEEQTKDQGIFRQILECSISAKEDFEQIAKLLGKLLLSAQRGANQAEKFRRFALEGLPESDAGHVDLVAWLTADGRELVDEYARLYVPRNDARWLKRNARIALANVG